MARPITKDEILEVVADHFGLFREEIKSKSRTRVILIARQVAMYLTKELTGHSFESIGRIYNRNHATALHAKKKTIQRMKEDSGLKEDVEVLRLRILLNAGHGSVETKPSCIEPTSMTPMLVEAFVKSLDEIVERLSKLSRIMKTSVSTSQEEWQEGGDGEQVREGVERSSGADAAGAVAPEEGEDVPGKASLQDEGQSAED